MNPIEKLDPAVWQAIRHERGRQQTGLEMIASENYTSPAVLAAQGSVLTNKYAEGYPGRRYYGGCEFVDVVEKLAIDRAMKLFGAEHANVQPHSGASANMAAYFACLEPGDTILAMNLAHGGHLTHGMPLNFSGKLYKIIPYGVRKDTERIDYDEVAALAKQHRPKLIVAGASAYSRVIDFARFGEIAKESGALLMVDMAHIAGLVAGDQHPSPVPWADFVTSTTHKTLRGPRSGFILCKKEWAKKVDSAVFPGMQGGPLMHVVAAKAIGFGEALQPAFRGYASQIVANARTLAHELMRPQDPPRLRRDGQPPRPRRRHVGRADRQTGREVARRRRHHGQPQRHPVRHAAAARPVGRAHRHPGADDARDARDGDAHHRRLDRRRPRRPGRRAAARHASARR